VLGDLDLHLIAMPLLGSANNWRRCSELDDVPRQPICTSSVVTPKTPARLAV